MRHPKALVLIFALLINQFAFAQEETCAPAVNELYVEIQIYHRMGTIGERLQKDIQMIHNPYVTADEKIEMLEDGFAKCDIVLTRAQEMRLGQK